MSHVASTYSAVMAVVNVAHEEAYDIIDIPKMKQYLISVKNNFKSKKDMEDSFFQYVNDSEFSTHYNGNDPSQYIGTIPGSMAIH